MHREDDRNQREGREWHVEMIVGKKRKVKESMEDSAKIINGTKDKVRRIDNHEAKGLLLKMASGIK